MKQVSFCIPVMNRLDDIKVTLEKNLLDNIEDKEIVEFIVVSFDKDLSTSSWIRANFKEYIDIGYLKVFDSDILESWHFGKAKNVFKELLSGNIYSSLDADNFTGHRCGKFIFDIFKQNNYQCIIHHFRGNWGDGTCGRVTVPRKDYCDIGYDDKFLPRQWDELDLILSVMLKNKGYKFYHYKNCSILDKSVPMKRFLTNAGVNLQTLEISNEFVPPLSSKIQYAIGTNDDNYVSNNKTLSLSSKFNHLLSFVKNSTDHGLSSLYLRELKDVQNQLLTLVDLQWLESVVFDFSSNKKPIINEDSLVLVSCVKNPNDLNLWFDHYRKLGVSSFFIIDDGSKLPIIGENYGSDVFVWNPKVGDFKSCKIFWIEILLRYYLLDKWVLTLDSDEYLEADFDTKNYSSFRDWLKSLRDTNAAEYLPAMLLDMVPNPSLLSEFISNESLSFDDFNCFMYRKSNAPDLYKRHFVARWGYGLFVDLIYKIDIRFRVNQSFDCLRKFPCFIMKSTIHLNQGFHDLFINGVPRTTLELSNKNILIIRHFKLYVEYLRWKESSSFAYDSYHPDTSLNLKKLNKNFKSSIVRAMSNPFILKWSGAHDFKNLIRGNGFEK